MIIVTGATGHLGRAIVEKLIARIPATQIGVSVRDMAKAADLEALGIRVRQGDFGNPESLTHAFEGATQVLMVSSNARATGGDPLAQHRAALEAARAAGARRIVYTSHMAASATSAFPPMRDHAATETMLRECWLPWTALRNGFYASSGIALMGNAMETGVLEMPADGKIAWTAHADLAEAAAIILSAEGQYDGPTPPLTGSEVLDFADLAQIASALLHRPIRRQIVTEDEIRATLAARGAPAHVAGHLLGLCLASRNGEFAPADPTLEQLLSRRPIRMRDVIADNVGE